MAKFYEIPADYVSHLPEVLQDMEDIQLMAKIINPYLDALNGKIKRIVDNKTVTFADAEGISRWEQILGVSPPIGGTLEDRRNACLAKLRARGVINLDTLRRVVETYLGVPVEIEMWWDAQELTWQQVQEQYKSWHNASRRKWGDFYRQGEPYVIYIYYRGTTKIPDLAPLYEMLYELIPANLIIKVLYKFQTWGEILDGYRNWEAVKELSWGNIRLGSKTI